MIITLCDPNHCDNRPILLDFTPNLSRDFMYWRGEIREIAEIHYLKSGIQIQLFKCYKGIL